MRPDVRIPRFFQISQIILNLPELPRVFFFFLCEERCSFQMIKEFRMFFCWRLHTWEVCTLRLWNKTMHPRIDEKLCALCLLVRAQDRANMGSRWPKVEPRCSKLESICPNIEPRCAQHTKQARTSDYLWPCKPLSCWSEGPWPIAWGLQASAHIESRRRACWRHVYI